MNLIEKILSESGVNFLREAEYWGTIAGGVVPFCHSTKRFLLGFRSAYVMEPHTWGGFGGKLDIDEGVDETVIEAVRRELHEETGYAGAIQLKSGYVYKNTNFEYHNFIGIVAKEFNPNLNWENDKAQWMSLGELIQLRNKHFGLSAFIKNSTSLFYNLIGTSENAK